jgi:hypothetical protein
MEVIPLAGSIQARTGTVQAGNKVKIVGIFEGLAQEDLPGKDHTFVFKIVGIKNQRSAANAGAMSIQTFVQGGNGTAYKVDYGETDETFPAVTGRVIQNGEIEVINPVTYATTSSYILRFRTESAVPEGGRVTIEIPEPFEIYENIMTSGGTCASATCSVDVEDRTVTWTITE